jgi:hypothetical protein
MESTALKHLPMLFIPDLEMRNANFEVFLPPTAGEHQKLGEENDV